MSAVQNYSRFVADNPALDFSFLYPSDWQVREVKGKEYDEVFILGPRSQKKTYSLSLTVRAARGESSSDLETLAANYLARNNRMKNFREVSRAAGSLAGVEAMEIEMGYSIPLPINTVNPQETPVLERTIFIKKARQVYEIAYKAVEEDYYKYLHTFKNATRTFEFREDAAQQTHWPVVMPAAAHAIREQPAGYKPEK